MKRKEVKFHSNGSVEISLKNGNTIYTNFITREQYNTISNDDLFGKDGLVYKAYSYSTNKIKRSRCYNAGKVGGLEKVRFSYNFFKADNEIFFMGYKPISPLKNGLPDKAPYWLHMFVDLCLLASCKAAYFQENWKDSRGAKIEHMFATFLGKEIWYQEDLIKRV